MSSIVHDEDKLLDYAYGELSPSEAKSVEAHLKSCSQCSHALEDIRKVRRTMAQLPTVPAPTAGLDSLLAYAEQAARRAPAGPPQSRWWKWVLLPGTGALAMLLLIVVSTRVAEVTSLSQLRSAPAPKVLAQSRQAAPPAAAPSEPTVAVEVAESAKDREAPAKAESKPSAKMRVLALPEQRAPRPIAVATPKTDKPGAQQPPARMISPSADQALGLPQSPGLPLQRAEPQAPPAGENAVATQAGEESARQSETSEIVVTGRSRLAKSAAPPPEPSGVVGGVVGSAPREGMQPDAFAAPIEKTRGDALAREILRVQGVLRRKGVTGLDRAWLLNHLCELLYAANRTSEANSTCDQVIQEFPGSAAADAARQLKAKHLPAQGR